MKIGVRLIRNIGSTYNMIHSLNLKPARGATYLRHTLMLSASVALSACTASTNSIDSASRAAAATSLPLVQADASRMLSLPGTVQSAVDAGLNKQEALFEARSNLIEAMLLRQAHGWSRLPSVVPAVSVNDEGTVTAQVSADLVLLDWGKSGGQKQVLDARVLYAQMELWAERNGFLQELSEELTARAGSLSRIELIQIHLKLHEDLQKQVEERVQAGVGEATELPLVALRIQELRRDLAIEKSKRVSSGLVLEQLTGLRADILPEPDLEDLLKAFNASQAAQVSPALQMARCDVLIADGNIRVELADRLPAVVLSGITALAGGGSSGITVGLQNQSITDVFLQTNTKIARSTAVAALATLRSEEEQLKQNETLFKLSDREVSARIATIARQIELSREAIATFERQLSVGARPLTDAVAVYERLFESEQLLIAAEQERVILQVRRLAELGALTPRSSIELEAALDD